MKQGAVIHGGVHLLLSKGHFCYRPRRTRERKRKSVHGCSVDANTSVLNLVIVKKKKKERRERYSWTDRHYCSSWALKELAASESFLISLKMLSVRKPLKKVRSVGPMCPRFSILLFYMSCNTNASVLLLWSVVMR